jgi:hypothetical protein
MQSGGLVKWPFKAGNLISVAPRCPAEAYCKYFPARAGDDFLGNAFFFQSALAISKEREAQLRPFSSLNCVEVNTVVSKISIRGVISRTIS